MAVYGITRLLGSRELGPTQIVPTLDGFRGDLATKRDRLDPFLAELERATAPHPDLAEAYSIIGPLTADVLTEVNQTFDRTFKLGAKQRLDLEREAPELGGRLQACRALLDTVLAGLEPQPIPLRLADILDGPFCRPPIFVERTHHLLVGCNGPMIQGEVRVLRPMIEVIARGRSADSSLDFLAFDPKAQALFIQPNEGALLQTVDRIALPLGPALGVEADVVSAVGRHLGATLALDGDAGRITFAA